MSRMFNIAGDCKPKLHYMVDLHSRLEQMQEYVDKGAYFAINRARQYGKTTMLRAFQGYLKGKYYVVSMDFQMQMSDAKLRSEHLFCAAFAKAFVRILQKQADGTDLPQELKQAMELLKETACVKPQELDLVELFQYLSDICGKSVLPLVLIVDEADQAAGHSVFLDFLSQIRGYYIDRDQTPTFQSVILAGVYDIRNLKRRVLHQAVLPAGEREMYEDTLEAGSRNSPWNISVDFKVDMSFSPQDIAGMLAEYEKDYHVGMDICEMANVIYEHTAGYPYLVSSN
ncbi:MAG: ATP-binding protein [Eubacterium sp.]|nr:ATP-binding protein [Eubacterium sp.]